MLKSTSVSKKASTRSVNIRVIKPTGIKSVWNWFTNRNKKGNLQNIMFDKKFKLKLNTQELEALKQNGMDFQKLQNFADGKMRKKIFILPKDQSELDKNVLLNNSILCELMKNKGVSKKQRKYKKSVVTTSSLSIKSKNNIIDSNITYIQSIKSKKSIVNSGSSKASLKVGLKSTIAEDVQMNKNVIIKGAQEALLKRKMQKKVFVPIYLGTKKSSKVNKGNNDNKVENKILYENECNVIPLLLSKLKTMEGQISGIENTTNKINEAVSQKNMIDTENPSKGTKKQIHSNKGSATLKMYPKRSFKRFKPNKTESTGMTNLPSTSFNSAYNAHVSFNKTGDLKNSITKLRSKDKMTNIKNIFDDPENFLKHHTFVIPSNLSEKALFNANPNVGCDVMLKLFEALTESNNSHHETSADDNQTNIFVTNNSDSESPKQNLTDTKVETKGLTSISESQLGMLTNKADGQNKSHSQSKKNISCPTSSTVIGYKDIEEVQTLSLENNLASQKDNGQLHKNQDDQIPIDGGKTKLGKLGKNTNNSPSPNSENFFIFPKKDKVELNCETMLSTTNTGQENNEITTGRIISGSSCESSLLFQTTAEDKLKFVKKIPESNLFESNIKNSKNCENNDLKGTSLQESGQVEKQVIKVPIPTDSKKICSICIEPTLDLNLGKPEDPEDKDSNLSSDAIKEPKLSITILVKNNLNDGMSNNGDIKSNIDSTRTYSSETREDNKYIKGQNSITPPIQEDSYNRLQNKEKNVDYNSEKYVPPLRLETFNSTPRSLASSGFVRVNNVNTEQFLNKPKLEQRAEFGFEGVSYLNQEKRKILDAQMSKSVNSKLQKTQNPGSSDGKIQKIASLKPGAKSSLNLKNNCLPIRHLSESSLYLKKYTNGKTINKPFKICRKNPYESLESLKIQNKLNTTKKLDHYNTNHNKLTSNQGLDGICIPVIRNKKLSTLNSSRNKQTNINCSDMISSKEFITSKNKTYQKQDFYIVCKEKSIEDSRNTGIHQANNGNSSCIKKRFNRCHMTLKEPSSNNLADFEKHFNKTGKGDHQARNIELISTKEVFTSGENLENTSTISYPSNEETPSVNHVSEDPALLTPPQIFSSSNENHKPDSLPPPEKSPKYPDNIAKAAGANPCEHLNSQVSGSAGLKQKNIFIPGFVPFFGDEEIQINCVCILTKSDSPLSKGDAGSQSVILQQLQPLSTNDLPMVCPCFIKKTKAAAESFIRKQAEILIKESMTHQADEPWKLNLICTSCSDKLHSGRNANTETLEPDKRTLNKHELEDIDGTNGNSNHSCNCNPSSELHVLKNEKTTAVLDSKSSNSLSDSVENKNNFHSFSKSTDDELLDTKLQNDTDHSDEKKGPCNHTCLKVPSDEGSSPDTSDNKNQNSFCLNAVSESDCSNGHKTKSDITKGIVRFLCKRNGAYKVENITHSTTVFHFNDEEEFTSTEEIPIDKPVTLSELTNIGDSTVSMGYKESSVNNNFMQQKESNSSNLKDDKLNNDSQKFISINYEHEDPYTNTAITRNIQPFLQDQISFVQNNLEAGDGCFTHVSPAISYRGVKSNSEPNKQIHYYVEKNQPTLLNENSYKSFERSMLKTIKENDLENTCCGSKPKYVQYLPTQVVSSSTDYIVNYQRRVEYDITSKNKNSVYKCSVNSYTSTKSKR